MKKILLILSMVCVTLSSNAEAQWIGDADGDGQLTISDVKQLTLYILGEIPLPKDITLLDVNADKVINMLDVARLIHIIINPSEATKTWIPDNINTGGDKGPFD